MTGEQHFRIFLVFIYFCTSGRNRAEHLAHRLTLPSSGRLRGRLRCRASKLPSIWWDWLFGTYENPVRFEDRCGFDPEKEERLPEMLAWRDVHRG
jgi:hypothetical protein